MTLDAPLEKLPLLLLDGGLIPAARPHDRYPGRETNAEVIGPGDVDTVYDVVGFVSARNVSAAFTRRTERSWRQPWRARSLRRRTRRRSTRPSFRPARRAGLRTTWVAGFRRVRISTSDPDRRRRGLALSSGVARRIRWDLFLIE